MGMKTTGSGILRRVIACAALIAALWPAAQVHAAARITQASAETAAGAASTTAGAGQANLTHPARIATGDTVLTLAMGTTGPRIVSLGVPGGETWAGAADAALPARVFDSAGRALPLHWRLAWVEQLPARVSYVFMSVHPALRLRWIWERRAMFGPLDHSIEISNRDAEELWLPWQPTLEFALRNPVAGEPLRELWVEKGAATPGPVGTHREQIPDGFRWAGTSSTYAQNVAGRQREIIPWMAIIPGRAAGAAENAGGGSHQSAESAGGDVSGAGPSPSVATQNGGNALGAESLQSGWYAGIEFSGRVRMTLGRTGDVLSGTAGLNPDPAPYRTRLAEGAAVTLPAVFIGTFQGGEDEVANLMHHWVSIALLNPADRGNPNYPMLTNNSWGVGMGINEATAQQMIADAAGLGMEMFHLDAGWFRAVGDWYADPSKFPHDLPALADDAHQHGMKFGLWVDWTSAGNSPRASALSVKNRMVADWLAAPLPAGWKPEPFKGSTVDIGVPTAHDWCLNELRRLIQDNRLDMLEHDGYLLLKGCTHGDHPHAPPLQPTTIAQQGASTFVHGDNSTDTSYYTTLAYYDIYERLRKLYPTLLLEACNDGGRMVDFGTAAHVDYFSITDTYDPLSNRRAFYDASFALPPAMLESYVAEWPHRDIGEFRTMLRSGMMGWLTVMQDTTRWSAEEHAAARREFAFYKKVLRPLIAGGDEYHVSARPDGRRWDGIEFWSPVSGLGALYAFRGSAGEPQHSFRLRGLRADESFRLHFRDDSSPDAVVSGAELLRQGIRVHLAPLHSEIVVIEALKEPATRARKRRS
jgi:hypothetical protein